MLLTGRLVDGCVYVYAYRPVCDKDKEVTGLCFEVHAIFTRGRGRLVLQYCLPALYHNLLQRWNWPDG